MIGKLWLPQYKLLFLVHDYRVLNGLSSVFELLMQVATTGQRVKWLCSHIYCYREMLSLKLCQWLCLSCLYVCIIEFNHSICTYTMSLFSLSILYFRVLWVGWLPDRRGRDSTPIDNLVSYISAKSNSLLFQRNLTAFLVIYWCFFVVCILKV